ncbi:MAG: hypothetical protein QOK15_1212 [Nocardioidaceae bacterium]|nr:hypothetical protein [Nocardioidaceae bacterium]
MTNLPEPSGFLTERSSAHASWHWVLLDAAGADVTEQAVAPGAAPRFSAQGDAETWVGEAWRELAEKGVDAVVLYEADRLVYGPMSLRAGQ